MSRRVVVRLLLVCSLLAAGVTGCSRDPNVRKQKFFESGEKYFAEGKYREAAIQYSNATQIDPRFAQAHYQLGQTYLNMGDGRRAGQELARTIELAPDNYLARFYLAELLINGARQPGSSASQYLNEAKTHLDILRNRRPNDPETHEAWALYYAAQDKTGEALREAQLTVDADPSRSVSYLLLANLQLNSNLPEQGEASLRKAVEVNPKSMRAQLTLGEFYASRNRLPEAESQFRHAVDVDPKDPAPRTDLARLLMIEGKKDETESFLRQTKKDLSDNSEGYRMLGDFYAKFDVDKATAEYGSLYSDHPKDLLVKRNYIQLLILKNRLDEAAKLNNEILKANPTDALALVYKGQIQLRQNDPSGAIESLHNALKNNPDDADAHYWMGNAFAQQHNERQAESEWREAVKIRPNMTQALSALATLESNRGDTDAVLQIALQLIAAQPDSADGFVLKGVAERARQKYSDSEQDLLKAANLAPQSPIPYVQLGNLRQAQKQYPEAIKFYQQAFNRDAASTDALQGIMNSYLAEKQPDLAIEAAKAQIAKSPKTAGFYDLLGTALSQNKKDLQGAEAAFRKAVELDQGNGDALLKLGQVEVAKGFVNQTKDSMDQTLAMYQDHIKKNPRDFAFYILAGEMYASQGNWDQAKTMYQQALTISPDEPKACNNLAYGILEHGGNVDVALGLAQTARRGAPDWPSAADTLGWAYYQKGVYDSAISQFQEALRLAQKRGDPDDADLHYHLGLAYQKKNNPGLARQQLEKAVKLDPKKDDARKALSELHG